MKNLKRFFSVFIVCIIMFSLGVFAESKLKKITAYLNPDIKILLDGHIQSVTDSKGKNIEPIIYKDSVYLPVRSIGEIFGMSVEWEKSTLSVLFSDKDNYLNQLEENNNNKNDLNTIQITDKIKGINSETEKITELEESIKQKMNISEEFISSTRYYYNYYDLDNDNIDEVIVQVISPYTSGTSGDTVLIFKKQYDEYTLIQKFSQIKNPIIISYNKSNGWNDIITQKPESGSKKKYILMRYNGESYSTLIDSKILDDLNDVSGIAVICDDFSKDFLERKGLYLNHTISEEETFTQYNLN